MSLLDESQVALGERLFSDGHITREEWDQALAHGSINNVALADSLVLLGYVPPSVLGVYLEPISRYPFVDLSEISIPSNVAALIPEKIARKDLVLPFEVRNGDVCVAMVDPLNVYLLDSLRGRLHKSIVPYVALKTDLLDSIARVYDVQQKADQILDEIKPRTEMQQAVEVEDASGSAPIVRLVNRVIDSAIEQGASDIHIEPDDDELRVRFRIDGIMFDQLSLPIHHTSSITARLKIMSVLDISEYRRPQDGRMSYSHESQREYDLRVSTLPLIRGEKVVMRLLEKTSRYVSTDHLGMTASQLDLFLSCLKRPHGILLITGPTGSGKTTTLYAGLQQINDKTRNITTIEDPVEYKVKRINQVQTNQQIGLTFATALRSIVRQDPDVIMVGEIRDLETAEIAIQAALTGHLVLSTLHTNDAPGALVRLQQMGVEPFLISSAVIGVFGQRLVRLLCPVCKEAYSASQSEIAELQIFINTIAPDALKGESLQLFKAVGCRACGGRGMKGRIAVYEGMPMTPGIRDMSLKRSSGVEMKKQAISEGMNTLRESGYLKVVEGLTSISEVARVLSGEDN